MYPPECTFYLCRADEYAEATAGLRLENPEVIATYSVNPRYPTEEALLEHLKVYDALSYATLHYKTPIVICKPGWGHVTLVNPLPPLSRQAVVTVQRDADNPAGLYVEASHFAGGLFNGAVAVLTVSLELATLIDQLVGHLWEELDRLRQPLSVGDEEEYTRIHARIKLLTRLEAYVKDAYMDDVAYVFVESGP